MFYPDHEKQIYEVPGIERKFDPLVLERQLMRLSGARFWDLLATFNLASKAESGEVGDISEDGRARAKLEWRDAEEQLAKLSRLVFDLGECVDAQAMEYLLDFVEWWEGKGQRAKRPTLSPDNAGLTGP